jgi:LmbE family N-acetylglucosaminyl deacetylase
MTPSIRPIAPGNGRTILVVVAHADDAALFIGGTIAAWTRTGWNVVLVRVTDDRWDSHGLDETTTIERNRDELRAAAAALGIAEIVDLGLPTDVLGDASTVGVREHIIRAVRTHRPYALVTFDPYAMYGEDNLDHIVVGRAVDEAFWTSQFDLHHPEHAADGLQPHGCFERWYFGRRVIDVTDVIDISATLDAKVAAACLHGTMMLNYLNQLRLQGETGGWQLPIIEQAIANEDPTEVVAMLVRAGSERTGARYGVAAAEEFRIVTFGGMSAFLDSHGTPSSP